jgi:molybdopterin synthase sulfur carrier subunit
MPTVAFTENIQRHIACPTVSVEGATVFEAMESVFRENPNARGYVLDDRGAIRKHMVIFVDGAGVRDRAGLSDPVSPESEIYVMQALSGGQ